MTKIRMLKKVIGFKTYQEAFNYSKKFKSVKGIGYNSTDKHYVEYMGFYDPDKKSSKGSKKRKRK